MIYLDPNTDKPVLPRRRVRADKEATAVRFCWYFLAAMALLAAFVVLR